MIKVKFFGLLRLDLKSEGVEFPPSEVSDVRDLLAKLPALFPDFPESFADQIIMVNDVNVINLKFLRTKLKDGDTVLMLSPVSGG